MYINPAYAHHPIGESSTDDDYGEVNNGAQRTAWPGSAVKHTGQPGGGTLPQQQSSRRGWLLDAGIVVALLMAGLALGLTLGRTDPTDCSCATEVEAVSALHASEMQLLNSTLPVMRAEVNRLGRALKAARDSAAAQLDAVEDKATELCDTLLRSDVLPASMEVSQEIATRGAYDWEFFEVDNVAYLAVASFLADGDYTLMSRIYRRSSVSGRFELTQECETTGASDWEVFVMEGSTYLAVANHRNSSSFNVMSRIYRHSNSTSQFELVQELATTGARDWESFVIGEATFLAVANQRNGNEHNIMSCIYQYSAVSGQFETVQEIATSSAHDWEYFNTVDGGKYLVVANYYNSSYNTMSCVYRHSAVSGQFELFQEVPTVGAWDWEAFTIDAVTYLAVANSFDGTTQSPLSRIYRYSTTSRQFEMLQELSTGGLAHDWKAFSMGGVMYLAVANYRDGSGQKIIDSCVYRHSAVLDQFEVVAKVATAGAVDWEVFTLDEVTYLAVANNGDGSTYRVTSRIYAFDVLC